AGGTRLGHGGAQRSTIKWVGAQRLSHGALSLPVRSDRRFDVALAGAELGAKLVGVGGRERLGQPLYAHPRRPRAVTRPGVMAPRERRPRADEKQIERQRDKQDSAGPSAGGDRSGTAFAHGLTSGNGSGANTTAPMSLSATIEGASSPFVRFETGARSVSPTIKPSAATPASAA